MALSRWENMVRCPHCCFLFESAVLGLLPACRQCGGPTVLVTMVLPPPRLPALKFASTSR
jgi:hypothetical protein